MIRDVNGINKTINVKQFILVFLFIKKKIVNKIILEIYVNGNNQIILVFKEHVNLHQ